VSKRGFLTIEAKRPDGDGITEFFLPQSKVDLLARGVAPRSKYYEAFSLPDALGAPAAIFKGLGREGFAGGFCYSAKPRKILNDNVTVPPPPGYVFVVFVNESGHVYSWRWEKEDENTPGHPIGWETRFDDKLWPV
jgi:hypothetical protein